MKINRLLVIAIALLFTGLVSCSGAWMGTVRYNCAAKVFYVGSIPNIFARETPDTGQIQPGIKCNF